MQAASSSLASTDRVRLHPHLRLLHRDGDEIQLGFDSADAVVLVDPGHALAAVIEVMDGRFRLKELADYAAQLGVTPEQLADLVNSLTRAGALQPSRPPGAATRSVRLVGLGQAGARIGEQLLGAGIGQLIVVDPDDTTPWGGWASTRDRVRLTDHWSKPDPRSTDLTIVVSSTLEIDRAVTTGLTEAGQPHVLVRPRADGAVVGPLVIPGQTSCLHCGDLARTRADPAWPRLLAQLCRAAVPWNPLAADWAAALVTTQALGHLAGRTVETAAATMELGPVAWTWQRRVWAADPACGCCWSPPAEW